MGPIKKKINQKDEESLDGEDGHNFCSEEILFFFFLLFTFFLKFPSF